MDAEIRQLSVNPHLILEQLVSLTAVTDAELSEYSLLRIIDGFLQPLDLRIIRTDQQHQVQGEMVFNHERVRVNDSSEQVGTDIRQMLMRLGNSSAEEHSVKTAHGHQTLFKCHKSRINEMYLLVTLPQPMSRETKHLLSCVLKIFKNYTDLLIESSTDPLTGLLNRKTFDETIDRVYQLVPKESHSLDNDRRQEQDTKYWLVMIDIDHFKSINDTYGHLYGDDVLILLAQIIKGCFREDDLVFRFGGEEFVLIIRCDHAEGAHTALDRLLKTVENYDFPQVGQVTISAGVVRIDGHTFSSTLLDYADRALYYSKDNGRNQVSFYEDMVDEGLESGEVIKTGTVDLF